ncbi:MAG: biopolymer transporter ExbD [Phycisphaerae bacterium]|nr:biopolymer transporter ExbD [Phycisphaerae bacterium]
MTQEGHQLNAATLQARARSRRQRHIRRQRSSALSVNLTPMIDVTFLLLIFFLVTTTFEKPEGLFAANLPRDSGLSSLALPISPIVVRLTAEGDGCRICIDNFTRVPASFGDLADFLKNVQGNPGFDDQTPVVIIAEDTLAWDHVVGCWNAAVRASCKNIAFGTE